MPMHARGIFGNLTSEQHDPATAMEHSPLDDWDGRAGQCDHVTTLAVLFAYGVFGFGNAAILVAIEACPRAIGSGWRHILAFDRCMQVRLGDKMCCNRGCQKQEQRDHQLMKAEFRVGEDEINHRRDKNTAHTERCCFGWAM